MEEDLKCCGNCSHRNTMDMGGYIAELCNFRKENTNGSENVCEMWDFDNLKSKDRMIR
jgi:hypothetical protein